MKGSVFVWASAVHGLGLNLIFSEKVIVGKI